MNQRYWDDVKEGDEVPTISFPLTLYRLVVTAGANRDFNPHHHNSTYAIETGAPEIYANTLFLQSMWERVVRDFIGLAGTIRAVHGFRMRTFNTVGTTVNVKGKVLSKRRDGDVGLAELQIWSENDKGVTVGPGTVTVTLPLQQTVTT